MNLTKREKEIAEYLINGLSSDEIIEAAKIEYPTVKYHIGNIYKKFGVKNRAKFTCEYLKIKDESNDYPPAA